MQSDAGNPPPGREALLIEYLASTNAIDAVSLALEATGNPGLTQNNDLERHYRDVLCARARAPQNDSILTIAGRAGFAAAAVPTSGIPELSTGTAPLDRTLAKAD